MKYGYPGGDMSTSEAGRRRWPNDNKGRQNREDRGMYPRESSNSTSHSTGSSSSEEDDYSRRRLNQKRQGLNHKDTNRKCRHNGPNSDSEHEGVIPLNELFTQSDWLSYLQSDHSVSEILQIRSSRDSQASKEAQFPGGSSYLFW